LDSTNVITSHCSIITNIGLDHQSFLGNSIEAIAKEKGGIIRPDVPLILGEMRDHAHHVLTTLADQLQTAWYDSTTISGTVPDCPLGGTYQSQNKKTALRAIQKLQESHPALTEESIARGFERVIHNTGLRGRWEVLAEGPRVIADVGHNEDGLNQVMQQLQTETYDRLFVVLGMVNDKDVDHVLALFPKKANYHFCKANIPRGMDASLLSQKALLHHLNGTVYSSVQAAYEAALTQANESDLILVTGSFFTVAEVLIKH
jgi:dihydrofolate synthase/folylpolyglutamate synthase